jgi:hypothetical protein
MTIKQKQDHGYLDGAKSLSAERCAAAHGPTIRLGCQFAEGFGRVDQDKIVTDPE